MVRWVLCKGPGEGQTRLRGRDPRVLKRVGPTRLCCEGLRRREAGAKRRGVRCARPRKKLDGFESRQFLRTGPQFEDRSSTFEDRLRTGPQLLRTGLPG